MKYSPMLRTMYLRTVGSGRRWYENRSPGLQLHLLSLSGVDIVDAQGILRSSVMLIRQARCTVQLPEVSPELFLVPERLPARLKFHYLEEVDVCLGPLVLLRSSAINVVRWVIFGFNVLTTAFLAHRQRLMRIFKGGNARPWLTI